MDEIAAATRRSFRMRGRFLRRGRAMAGSSGNATSRIFCQKIEVELLAINGYYRTAEEINIALRNRPAQAWWKAAL